MDLREEIRTASMWQLMLKLTPVAVLGMSINSINTFVDALFIGQFLGEKALAAIALAFPLAFLSNSFAAMLGVGGSSILSIAIGAKDEESQRKTFGHVVILSIIVSGVLTILGWVFAPQMIQAIGGAGEVLALATVYYRIFVLGSFFQIFGVALNMLIRAEGKIKEAMIMNCIALVANMIINPIFIGYLELGIAGAAYATIIANILLAGMTIWYFWSGRTSYEVDLEYYKLESKLTRPILSIGTSAMMLQVMFVVQQIVVFRVIAYYGDDWDIAFMGACYRILILMLVPGFGFASAMQPVSGINFGAKDYARVKEAFFKFSMGSTILTTLLMLFFEFYPTLTLSLMLPNAVFSPTDIFNFRIMMAPGFLFSVFFMGIILFQSIGEAKVAGIVMILREIVFYVPIVIALPMWYGLTGVYATPIIQNTITLCIAAYLVWRQFGKWDKLVVAEKQALEAKFSESLN